MQHGYSARTHVDSFGPMSIAHVNAKNAIHEMIGKSRIKESLALAENVGDSVPMSQSQRSFKLVR